MERNQVSPSANLPGTCSQLGAFPTTVFDVSQVEAGCPFACTALSRVEACPTGLALDGGLL